MIRIGLTGNVGSGKSEVAQVWRASGVPVVDADVLAREVVAKGSPGLAEVVEIFGPDVLLPDGTLDRARLRRIVFSDAAARARLEGVIHPRIGELRREWLAAREAEGAPLVVCEIPLLYESGGEGDYDLVVLVHAPEEERERRLREGRGLSAGEARRIMASQWDAESKLELADHVLLNAGTVEELRTEAAALLDKIRADVEREGR